MFKPKNKSQKKQYKIVFSFLVLFCFHGFFHSPQAQSESLRAGNSANIYVFFDRSHSYIEQKNSYIASNFITVGQNLNQNVEFHILGSNNFCQNIFYFMNNKIIFYNPSQYMTSAAWCEVELTNKKTRVQTNYKFILNKTFSAWCEEKDTNLHIGTTVKAVLNAFQSNVCSEKLIPLLSKTRVLNLSNTNLQDISPLAGFLQVRSLWLDNNKIKSLDSLGSLRNLVFLSLNNNNISNAEMIGEMSDLKWVFLNHNQIIDVDFASRLKTLKFLGLKGNLISNPEPLFALSPSTYIIVNNNPFVKMMCDIKKEKKSRVNNVISKNCFDVRPKNFMFANN